jgi:hypothetical protein
LNSEGWPPAGDDAGSGSAVACHGSHQSSSAPRFSVGAGENGEELRANSPRQLETSVKRWFGLTAAAPSSKQRQTVVAFHGGFPATVKSETGSEQHDESSSLVGWAWGAVE